MQQNENQAFLAIYSRLPREDREWLMNYASHKLQQHLASRPQFLLVVGGGSVPRGTAFESSHIQHPRPSLTVHTGIKSDQF